VFVRVLVVIAIAGCHGDSHAPAATPPATPVAINAYAKHHDRDAGAPPAQGSAFYASTFAKRPSVTEMTALGELAFRDPSLSASGKLACATCHDPDHAFAPATDRPIQLGGADGKSTGLRATPSLRYLQAVPRFTEHYHDPDGDDGLDQGPAGGLTWDGRAQSLHDQARSPLYSPLEMANRTPAELAAKLRAAPYADRLRAAFGDDLAGDAAAEKALLLVLEVFQQDPARFYPYTSKLDAVLRGTATFTAAEARGKALFDDPAKGNCARCHPSSGAHPAFTDFGFVALGVPRARDVAPGTDLGLCGPLRTDLAQRAEYCGMFRTPSLRNVATRKRYFHNGAFKRLDDVVRFYATRDTEPARWYRGEPFDDLPARYRANIDREAPFGGKPGGKPRLTEGEISDIIAFLHALTDGT
jgi:cytochrome c peroxidase